LFSKKSLDNSAKEKLEKIKRITEKHKNKKKFVETTCTVCLEDIEINFESDKLGKNTNYNKESINQTTNPDDKQIEDNYPPEESKEINDENKQKKVFKATLECGHSFHSTCIADWMNRQNNCPVCREKIDKDDEDNSKPLSENLVNIHTHYHPTFSDLIFDFTTDTLTWSSPVRNTSCTTDSSGSYDLSSWTSGGGGASCDW
jgi:hypothetical protein